MYFSRRKAAAKFLYMITFKGKVVSYSLAYLSVHKWLVGDVPFYLKFWAKLTYPLKNADFESIFARSISAVILSEKSSIITNRKSTMGF